MADTLELVDGEVVLANGATGGVGSSFVQLASRRGARVVAVCSSENGDYARSLGAADVVDYAAGDVAEAVRSLHPGGIDAVADMHGGKEEVARLAEQVRAGGRVVSVVGAADDEALSVRKIRAMNVSGRVTTASLDALAAMLAEGVLRNPQIRSFGLDQAQQAFDAVATGHVRGKVVVALT